MTQVLVWLAIVLVAAAVTGPFIVAAVSALAWPIVAVALAIGFVRLAWFFTRE
ncbi:hypothetical protein LRS13_13845 [Svornostia abyssi]|uniref:Uncharacterized protein n=1 Tax=Svornostia abyssi TaxID=2898438 RepID=A0ABY5PBF6_9ACTN|nr:hypothetical protein LRS13_13845 [Parviterribacteraceae bacterium J379]